METADVLLRGKYMRVVRSIRQSVCTRGLCGRLRYRRVSLEYRPVAARNHYRMNIVTVAHVYYEYH